MLQDDTTGARLDPELGVPGLDALAATVRERLDVPVALVSLVEDEADRQVFPGMAGTLPGPWCGARQTPLSHSFCRYVVYDRRPLVISDARADARLRDNPAIEDLGVVAYAGFPVSDAGGEVIGSLCAIDSEPRRWSSAELDELASLAHQCSEQLRRHGRTLAAGTATDEAVALVERSRLLLTLSEALAETVDVVDVAEAVAAASTRQLGCLRAGLWLRQTDLPRDQGVLADGATPSPDVLCWVRSEDDGWEQATAYDRIPLDETTPVGLTALRGESLFIASRAEQNASWPDIAHPRQEGERRAFLPLISRARLLGTLALVWPETGAISPEQVRTVTAFAAYAAQAVERALQRQHRADALVALQRSLMPSLPQIDDVELAARYLPASDDDQIGGDWYDAMASSGDRVDLTIGDVMGHDVGAAASMGQFRTILRVLAATIDDGPAAQVARLDRAIADLDIAGMATLVHGRLSRTEVPADPVSPRSCRADADTDYWDFSWSNAGHLPPIAVMPTGEACLLETKPSDIFLGVMPERPRSEHRVSLPAGSTLLLYTDGLVERRGERIDDGLARLRHVLADIGHLPPDELVSRLVDLMLPGSREDDVAVLAVRLSSTGHVSSPASS